MTVARPSPEQSYESATLTSLTPHPENPRRGDVGKIRDSIEASGFYGALLVQRSTGHVLAGNHRLLAARAEGLTSVPVIYLDVDDDAARRVLLADNRTADLATYDEGDLAALLTSLPDLTGTGYTSEDLAKLIEVPALEEETEQPRLDERVEKDPVTCPACGHLFLL